VSGPNSLFVLAGPTSGKTTLMRRIREVGGLDVLESDEWLRRNHAPAWEARPWRNGVPTEIERQAWADVVDQFMEKAIAFEGLVLTNLACRKSYTHADVIAWRWPSDAALRSKERGDTVGITEPLARQWLRSAIAAASAAGKQVQIIQKGQNLSDVLVTRLPFGIGAMVGDQ